MKSTFDKVLGGLAILGTVAGLVLGIKIFINDANGDDE